MSHPTPSRNSLLLSLLLASLCGSMLGGCVGTPYIPPATDSTGENTDEAPTSLPPVVEAGSESDDASRDGIEPPQSSARKNAAGLLLAQSETLRQNGQLPQAVALVERAIRLEPSRGDLWIQLGRLRFEGGELARAEQYARKGIALSRIAQPTHRLGWLLLADVSDARGDAQGAMQIRSRWLNERG